MFRKLFYNSAIICDCVSNKSRHAIITGATSGIGLATAHELAKRQWSLTLGCRNVSEGETVKRVLYSNYGNDKVSVQWLDLTDLQSIRSFTSHLPSSISVDVLINNAGVLVTEPNPSISIPNVDLNMMTNCLGGFFLLKLLMPRFENVRKSNLKSDRKPRIIFVSSSLAANGDLSLNKSGDLLAPHRNWDAKQSYANSKQAMNLCAREIYNRYGTGDDRYFDVYCTITGGMIATNLNRHLLAKYPAPAKWMIRTLCSTILKTPFEGCQSIVHCAVSDNVFGAHGEAPKSVNPENVFSGSGRLYSDCKPIEWPASSEIGEFSIAVYSKANELFNQNFC